MPDQPPRRPLHVYAQPRAACALAGSPVGSLVGRKLSPVRCPRAAVVGSQLQQIPALVQQCKAESIEVRPEDIARMRDCAALQRHLKVKLATETATAMIGHLFASFSRKGSKGSPPVLKKQEYTEFVVLVAGYELLTHKRFAEECGLMGATPSTGVELEHFTKLYTELGRDVRKDYKKVFI